ncbi:Hypothetical protein, putative [Bodo saltans]|uniref:Uncharacterized protein n=1 Tax=Bodo saltans TaxID=75058 RepID=A0A0S4J181_BODSA|nr:Hypothetical protein, putative [Bodo saltans]|eukprot:CUG44985.1 Hypothetical protein, putative [Bodo saltans]
MGHVHRLHAARCSTCALWGSCQRCVGGHWSTTPMRRVFSMYSLLANVQWIFAPSCISTRPGLRWSLSFAKHCSRYVSLLRPPLVQSTDLAPPAYCDSTPNEDLSRCQTALTDKHVKTWRSESRCRSRQTTFRQRKRVCRSSWLGTMPSFSRRSGAAALSLSLRAHTGRRKALK